MLQNKAEAPDDAVFLQKTGDTEMYLYPGLLLIGHLQEKKNGVINGGFYRVVTASLTECVVACEATGKTLQLATSFVAQHLRLAFAITQASAQGSTLKGRIRIYSRHARFTRRHLFVCLSRATAAELVEVV